MFFFLSLSLLSTDACPANTHIERNYTDCGLTCQNRNGTGTCSIQTVGCVCDPGYFRNGNNGPCVKECDCGCLDSNSAYHAVRIRLHCFFINRILV